MTFGCLLAALVASALCFVSTVGFGYALGRRAAENVTEYDGAIGILIFASLFLAIIAAGFVGAATSGAPA